MQHPHKALIEQHIKDVLVPVWYRNEYTKHNWYKLSPSFGGAYVCEWHSDSEYHVGHEPPQKMCEIAGVKFPMPMQVAPEIGTKYFVAEHDDRQCYPINWTGDEDDKKWLSMGILQATEEGAFVQSKALRAAIAQAIRDAK